jgi:hypothetical protein
VISQLRSKLKTGEYEKKLVVIMLLSIVKAGRIEIETMPRILDQIFESPMETISLLAEVKETTDDSLYAEIAEEAQNIIKNKQEPR